MNLKGKRMEKGLTQEEIAKSLGVSQQAVAKWEMGEAKPQADKLPALAKLLGCTIDDLFNEKGDQK